LTTRHDNVGKPRQTPVARPNPTASTNGAATQPASTARLQAAPRDQADLSGDRFFDYKFKDPELLALALTHSSLAYERHPERVPDPGSDNERLGVHRRRRVGAAGGGGALSPFPRLARGGADAAARIAGQQRNLAQVALRIELGPMLRMGRGEEHSGGQKKPALLANALEAVIAAMYLDGGLAPARDFVLRHIVEPAEAELTSALDFNGPLLRRGG